MKLVSWNVNGIRACLQKGFEDAFLALDADILCLQETKVQQGQTSLAPSGYSCYWSYAEKKGYSGTAVFSRQEPLAVFTGMHKPEHNTEGRLITLEFEGFYFVCCYTPNAQDGLRRIEYRMQWEDAFREYLLELDAKKPVIFCGDLKESPSGCKLNPKQKPIIVCGDLNVAYSDLDLARPNSNHGNPGFSDEEREKFRQLLDCGFVDSFRYLHPNERKYSWWSYRAGARYKNIGWRIDYFLTSENIKDKIIKSEIHTDIFGSDHCPIELEIDL